MTPPPATISGLAAERITPAARAMTDRSGSGRATCQVRSAKSDSGQSNASACTSCGRDTVAVPVSTGSVSTRIAPIKAAGSCSGRHTRSKKRDSGLNASLTVISLSWGCSRSCRTGVLTRVANVSDGSSSTGSRLMVARAAPVSMLVEPGPMLAVTAHACSLSFCLAYAAAVCTIACSLRPNTYRSPGSVPALAAWISSCNSAWPMPATLPCPKMPKQPAKNLLRSPSRSTNWLARNRTVAWATVSRTVGSSCGDLNAEALETTSHSSWVVQGQPRVDGPVVPGAAQPGMFGIVDNHPGALGARSCHHVEVVHVIARRRDRRTVVAVRHQHDVAGAHLLEYLDGAVGRAVHPVVAEPARTVGAGRDLEVVDLLELRLGRRVLVVLVRRIARPVPAGGDHLARDQRIGLEDTRGAEVVHLTAAVACTPQLDGHVGGGHAAVGERPFGAGAADRESAFTAEPVLLPDAEVDHVGGSVEDRRARRQFVGDSVALYGASVDQRKDHHLGVAGVRFEGLTVVEFDYLQGGFGPTG